MRSREKSLASRCEGAVIPLWWRRTCTIPRTSIFCGTRYAVWFGRRAARASEHGVVGWRQWRHLTKSVKMLFNRVRSTRRARPEHVEAYLECCRDLVERAQATLLELALRSATPWKLMNIEYYLGHAVRQIDHVERRLLKGETIPQDEKVFSIFESHTRWISKGKAGTAGGTRGSGLRAGR